MKQKLLSSAEQYFKTDIRYLLRGGFWVGLGHTISAINGLIVTVAFANLLPREEFGIYQFVMSVAAFLGAFTLTGLATALTRATARGSEVLRPVFVSHLKWSLGITLAAGLLALYYFVKDNYILATSFLIVGSFSPFLLSFGLYQPYLIGKEAFRDSALLGLWRKPLPTIALVVALFLTDNPILLVLTYYVFNTVSFGLIYKIVQRRITSASNAKDARDTVTYSKHLSFLGLLGRLAEHADKILIFHLLGATPVAIYAVASTPVNQIRTLLGFVPKIVFPKLSQNSFLIIQQTLPRKVAIFLAGTLLIILGYIFVAPYVYSFLFPLYLESVPLTQLLALILLMSPMVLFGKSLSAHKKKKELYILRVSVASVKVVLLYVFILKYGLFGSVYALLTANAFAAILVLYLFKRKGT